jgi:hypothetical protein
MRPLLALGTLAFLVANCSGEESAPTLPASPEQARLVVLVVYDQFPSWARATYGEYLSPEGALRRTASRGAEHVVEYAHASTHTAPGHAAISTGMPPSESGVAANEVWTEERGIRSSVGDGKHNVIGLPDLFASPTMVRAESVADVLRETHGDRARVVGRSGKDRGAILTTGRDPELLERMSLRADFSFWPKSRG